MVRVHYAYNCYRYFNVASRELLTCKEPYEGVSMHDIRKMIIADIKPDIEEIKKLKVSHLHVHLMSVIDTCHTGDRYNRLID
jgi:hypothetical protein